MMRRSGKIRPPFGVLLALSTFFSIAPTAATAADERFEIGLRFDAVGADGTPTNDQLGAGLYGRWRLSERWWLGAAVDQASDFDVERPYEFLGLVADPRLEEIDAVAESTSLTAWLEREYDRPGRLDWFWSVGAGASSVDVDDFAGPLAGGGSFDIAQEVGTELLLLASGGARLRLGERWRLELALRLDQHFTDWRVTDRVSGRTAELDDYLVRGVHLGVACRF